MKIENIGNKVANQFVISDNNILHFQSYQSVVAKFDCNTKILTLGRDWDYSNTTLKHLYTFLLDYCNLSQEYKGKDKLQKLIDNGIILYDENL